MENMAVSMKATEPMIQRSAFPKPPINLSKTPVIPSELAHTIIIEEMVAQELMTQSATKTLSLDKMNF